MRRCVELSLRAAGQTRPNPAVGCVITDPRGTKVLGEGYHRRAGESHAEVNALTDARDRHAALGLPPASATQGATAYVTLEPCNHYGRTPPCSKALIEAGIVRCVIGVQDPDDRTAGGGIQRMRNAGIDVVVGTQGELCKKALEGFISRIERKRPFGVLKYAMTLDGKIASESGSSQWVTGAPARRFVHHELRARMDAIVVGGQTVRRDNPSLTARYDVVYDGPLRPMRVVMTTALNSLPRVCHLWENVSPVAQTIVFAQSLDARADSGSSSSKTEQSVQMWKMLEAKGVEVIVDENVCPESVMETLYDKGCLNVLWECGGQLAAKTVKSGMIDKVYAFIAPKLIGGESSPSPIGSPALHSDMGAALTLHNRELQAFDDGDILISGYLSEHTFG